MHSAVLQAPTDPLADRQRRKDPTRPSLLLHGVNRGTLDHILSKDPPTRHQIRSPLPVSRPILNRILHRSNAIVMALTSVFRKRGLIPLCRLIGIGGPRARRGILYLLTLPSHPPDLMTISTLLSLKAPTNQLLLVLVPIIPHLIWAQPKELELPT